MITILQGTADLAYIIGFAILGCIVAFLWAPFLTRLLFKFHMVKGVKTELTTLTLSPTLFTPETGRAVLAAQPQRGRDGAGLLGQVQRHDALHLRRLAGPLGRCNDRR